MNQNNELKAKRNEIYSGSSSVFWIMSVFCVFVLLACVAVDLVVPSLTIITLPLIFFPSLFACIVILYTIKFGGTVTIGNTFKIGFTYFGNPNFGCFKLLKNLLKAFLVYLCASLVLGFILTSVYSSLYGSAFLDSVNELSEMLMGDVDIEVATAYITDQSNLSVQFLNLTSGLSISCGVFAFVYGIAFSIISVYLRINLQQAPGMAVDGLINSFFRYNKSKYRKDFWALNWPIFVLFLLGNIISYIVVILAKLDLSTCSVIASLFGFFLCFPYLPFFFANMEALFNKYGPEFKKTGEMMTKEALESLRNRTDLSEEERKQIENIIEERNKKDSNDNNEES